MQVISILRDMLEVKKKKVPQEDFIKTICAISFYHKKILLKLIRLFIKLIRESETIPNT